MTSKTSKKEMTSSTDQKKEWTWQEISTHNRRDSCWIYVNDDVYDATPWLSKHPGGEELVLLFAGRDCTESMRAYHPFTDKPYAILEKLKIGKLKGPSEIVRWDPDTGFYKAVRQRCSDYFKKNNLNASAQTWRYELFRLSWILMFLFFATLNVTKFREWGVPLYQRVLLSCILGINAVIITLNVMHLTSHTPLFGKSKFNYFLGWFIMDATLGYSFDIWLHEHLIGHHQYTNILAVDPNVPEGHGEEAVFRGSPNQKWYKRFYYQALWVPMMAFMVLVDYRMSVYRYWVKGYRKEIRVNAEFLGIRSKIYFTLGKMIWLFRIIYLPVFCWGVPLWEAALYALSLELTAGYFAGINLPANHITTDVDWPLAVKDEKTGNFNMGSEWATAQVTTCKDYAHDSWIFSHVFGALNNHSCHHLFPAMHHSYYAEIYPIVKQTAKEWNVKVPDVGTYADLLYDFVRNLWELSSEPPTLSHSHHKHF